MKIAIESPWSIILDDNTEKARNHLADHCFSVLDALCKMEESNCGVSEPDLSIDFSEKLATYTFIIDAATLDNAAQNATDTMRSAIHEAGGFTPNWEGHAIQLRIVQVEEESCAAVPTLTFAS